jgi:hypothetical protein
MYRYVLELMGGRLPPPADLAERVVDALWRTYACGAPTVRPS